MAEPPPQASLFDDPQPAPRPSGAAEPPPAPAPTAPAQAAASGKGGYSAKDIEVLEGLEPVRMR
ncbi:MAG: topoisomerase subunit, partial [Pseudomonadota bacterium]